MNYAVILSGGIDSATVLGELMNSPLNKPECKITAISFMYPSKHNNIERACAKKIATHYGIGLYTVDVTDLFDKGSSALLQNGLSIPEGHYADENMKATVVPMRNPIFVMVAASRCMGWFDGNFSLSIGIHAGDHAIYPDCRPYALKAMNECVRECSDGRGLVRAPFLHFTKDEIVRRGLLAEVPYHLTRTCYTDNKLACGKCGSCVERLEAFHNNNVDDPIEYQI